MKICFSKQEFSIAQEFEQIINFEDGCYQPDALTELEAKFRDEVEILNLEKSKLSALYIIFLKYLNVRESDQPNEMEVHIEATAFIVATIINFLRTSKDDPFEPDNLWRLFHAKGIFFNDKLLKCASLKYEERILATGSPFIYSKISLFGEFLFFFAGKHTQKTLLAEIKVSGAYENSLVEDIPFSISQKLGILIFIVYRNWANGEYADSLPKQNYGFPNSEPLAIPRIGFVHGTYSAARKRARDIPIVNQYYEKFLRYLGTQACQSYHLFGKRVIEMDYINSLESAKMKPPNDGQPALAFVFNYILDLILRLHEIYQDEDLGNFQDIPRYLESQLDDFPHFHGPNENLRPYIETNDDNSKFVHVEALLIAISLFIDFLFLDNWKNEQSPIDCITIWHNNNTVINKQCLSIRNLVEFYQFFPFYRKTREICPEV